MDSTVGGSPRRLARMAGALYLINILGSAYAITIVPAMLVVQGDLAATAHNLQTHELLYRSGLALLHSVRSRRAEASTAVQNQITSASSSNATVSRRIAGSSTASS
jgi:hypothetical protein